jgi:hypothetical protein
LDIPGMIEPLEEASLRKLASELILFDGDVLVEFGPFFGKSTAAIVAGLFDNVGYRKENQFYTYDSFECDVTGRLYPRLHGYAEKCGKLPLIIQQKNGRANFYGIFEHFLGPLIENKVIVPVKAELINSYPPDNAIAFMHIDSPKYYEELKPILFRFLPKMRKGSVIVFQDFFFQWSATLIAACAILIDKKILQVVGSAASSLICKCENTVNDAFLYELDISITLEQKIVELIEGIESSLDEAILDRSDIFMPRLVLAKLQWLYERGEYAKAVDLLISHIKNKKNISASVVNDFLDLLRNGFSIRESYVKDRQK